MADIYLTWARGRENMQPTIAAVKRIYSRHFDDFNARGIASSLRFCATIEVERAAAYARAGHSLTGAILMFKAFVIWPFQRKALFEQVFRMAYNKIRGTLGLGDGSARS